MNSLPAFTRACIVFAAAVIAGTPVLLLCGGRLAQVARVAWADGIGLEALGTLAVVATVAAAGALIVEATHK